MKIFGIRQRAIALLLVAAFVSFLQAEIFPTEMRENGATETTVSHGESEMGMIEKPDTPQKVVKKKRFPWLLVAIGGVVVLGAAAYLVIKNLKGKYGTIAIRFQVTLKGSNMKIPYKVFVDDQLKLDETFVFDVHFSEDYSTEKEFVRTFLVDRSGLGAMNIRVESSTYEMIWKGERASIMPPVFELEILSYKFSGKDQGKPVLDKSRFQVDCYPFDQEHQIMEEVVTISAPVNQASTASLPKKAVKHHLREAQ